MRPPLPPLRIVVLASGGGSNFEALARGIASRDLDLGIAALVTDRAEAPCVRRAGLLGIPALVLPAKGLSRSGYDRLLAARVAALEPDWIFLLGWMRILGMDFLGAFPGRVVNLHPALPGAFPGTQAIERAWEAARRGALTETGVMLHLVPDEGIDTGPPLALEHVAIDPGEGLEALEARMHAVEHRLVVDFALRLPHESVP